MDTVTVQHQESGLTFRDYIHVLFRQKWVILTVIITVALSAVIGLKLQTKSYVATVKMLITAQKQVESPYYKEVYGSREMEQSIQQAEIVKSDPVLMRVVKAQSLNKRSVDDEKKFSSDLRGMLIDWQKKKVQKSLDAIPMEGKEVYLLSKAKAILKESISVDPVRDTNMFTISVRDYNPVAAAIIANTVSRSYVIFDMEQQLAELNMKYGEKHPKVRYIQENIDKMTKKLDGEPLAAIDAIGPASVKIIEQATIPLKPSGTSKSTVLLLAISLSIFLGFFLAFIIEYSDQTIKTPRDIDQTLAVPFLGSIRRRWAFQSPIVDFFKGETPYGHSYRALCDHLFLTLKDKKIRSFMVASTLKTEDSASVVANMAAYFSKVLKQKVLLVDADLRVPAVHKIYGHSNDRGLADFLDNKAKLSDIVHEVDGALSFVAAGQSEVNPMVLFESERTAAFMKEAQVGYNLVIVRSSALRNHKDPSLLVRYTDSLLMLVDEGKVRRHVIQLAFEPLKGKANHILGVLMLNRTYPIPKWIYDHI